MLHPSPSPCPSPAGRIRFTPIVHLLSGEAVTLLAETEKRFEERAVFGTAVFGAECAEAATQTPAAWLADHIEAVANAAHSRTSERPVIVSAPMAALLHADTAMACDAAIRRTRLCPQEICIEVSDGELAVPNSKSQAGIEALRRCGFRVSVNATRSYEAHLSSALRLLLDSLRIDARQMEFEPGLQDRVEAATASGMSVIAEHASWRDGDYLASLGVEYGLRPRADA